MAARAPSAASCARAINVPSHMHKHPRPSSTGQSRSEYTAKAQRTADFYATAAEEAKARFKAEEQKYRTCPTQQQLDALHAARAAHEDAQKDASRTAEYLRRWSAFAARGH